MVLGKRLIFENCSNCGAKITDDEAALLIDEANDLVFCGEDCVDEYFQSDRERLETEHMRVRAASDIQPTEFDKFESYLPLLLSEPDEIWEPDDKFDETHLAFFIGEFIHEDSNIYYVAAAYMSGDKPTFVFMHFPTRDEKLIERYRQGTLIYDMGMSQQDEIFDDELDDEDDVPNQLYQEMLNNRADTDIDPEEFSEFAELKLLTVEDPEEIWRRVDDVGNTVLVYIAHHRQGEDTLAYVVVALADDTTETAHPAFGFPTLDQKLLDRYRMGELIYKAPEPDVF